MYSRDELLLRSLKCYFYSNKHQNNPLVRAETIRHSSTYIILYIAYTAEEESIESHTLKPDRRHTEEIVVTWCTGCCHLNKLHACCRLRWQICQRDNISVHHFYEREL